MPNSADRQDPHSGQPSQSTARRPAGTVQYDNRGRVVLVSGGAQGIGRAICEQYLQSGAQVVCLDAQPQPVDFNGELLYIQGDTAREDDCATAVETTVSRYGGLDVLVNNAAIQPVASYVRLDQLERDSWDRMLAINFTGYAFLAKYAFRVMLEQRSGVVINMASGQGHRTARQVPCYGPIKAANILQAMQWGVEYARHGIRVISVSPGAIRTPLVSASLETQGGERELANRHPLGRIGQPDEIAAAVLWLTSSAASFVTATDLAVDGGLGAFGSFADPYTPD